MTYTKIKTDYSFIIQRQNKDGSVSSISTDEANPDYQAYLRWLNGEPELEPIVRDPAPVEEILIQEVTVNE